MISLSLLCVVLFAFHPPVLHVTLVLPLRHLLQRKQNNAPKADDKAVVERC